MVTTANKLEGHGTRFIVRMAIVRIALFVLLLIGLAINYFVFWLPWRDSRAAQSWVDTPCRIIASDVKVVDEGGRSGKTFYIDITYQYQIPGGHRFSSEYDFTGGFRRSWNSCEEVVQRYPAGQQSVCYVNPQNYSEAVLSRSIEISWITPFLVLFPLALLVLTAQRRGKRLRSHQPTN